MCSCFFFLNLCERDSVCCAVQRKLKWLMFWLGVFYVIPKKKTNVCSFVQSMLLISAARCSARVSVFLLWSEMNFIFLDSYIEYVAFAHVKCSCGENIQFVMSAMRSQLFAIFYIWFCLELPVGEVNS